MLRAIENDKLQQNSAAVGGYLMEQLHELQKKHDIIGDVRGKGLMVGVDLVKDRNTKVCFRLFLVVKNGVGVYVQRNAKETHVHIHIQRIVFPSVLRVFHLCYSLVGIFFIKQ